MRVWGDRSQSVYDTLHPDLQLVADYILHHVADISLIYGHRPKDAQNRLFEDGKSKLQWPDSKHNAQPSNALDFQPYPYPNREEKIWGSLGYIAGRALEYAKSQGIELRWGGDWDGDGDTTDQNFDDLFHVERR